MSNLRVRFAPSPTGRLHIGGLRSALFNYLFAKKHGGTFILRIEDTDQKRTVPGMVEDIVDTLQAYGLVPDEGPTRSDGKLVERGDHGPYTQSQRLTRYVAAAKQLVEQGSAYPCFCTAERLRALRASQKNQHLPPGYDGLCRTLTPTDAHARIAQGEPHVVRFAMPKDGETVAEDLVRGQVTFKYATLEDSVLLKADGFPTYHLANVVDDHDMEITQVIRAEEWLPSLALHVLLYQAFAWNPPQFAHLPLILGPGRKKLSKRDGATAAADYRRDYLPLAVLNFIALLGWNPKTDRELYLNLAELAADFDLAKVHKAGAIFSLEKLKHFNRLHMKALAPTELAKVADVKLTPDEANRYLPLVIDRATTLSELQALVQFFTAATLTYDATTLVPKGGDKAVAQSALQALHDFWQGSEAWSSAAGLKTASLNWIKKSGLTNVGVLWPARVALTGQRNSPDVFDVAIALGKERSLQRLKAAQQAL